MQKHVNEIDVGAVAKVAELQRELERSCFFLAQLEASLSAGQVGNTSSKSSTCDLNHHQLCGVAYESEQDVVGGADTGEQHALLAAERRDNRNIRHSSISGAYPTSEYKNNRQKQVPVLVLEFPSEDADAPVSDVNFSSTTLPSGVAASQHRILPAISVRQRLASQSLKSLSAANINGSGANTVSGCVGTVSKSPCPNTLHSPPTNSPSEPGSARRPTTVGLPVPNGPEVCDPLEFTSLRHPALQQRRQQPLAPSPRSAAPATYRRSNSIGLSTFGFVGTAPMRISTAGVGPAGAGSNTGPIALQPSKETAQGGATSGMGGCAVGARALRHSTSGFAEARCPQLHSCVLEFPTLGMMSSPRYNTAGTRTSMGGEHSTVQRSSLDLQPLRRYTKTRRSVDIVRPVAEAAAAMAAAAGAAVQEMNSSELCTESLSAPLATIPSLNENGPLMGAAALTFQQNRAHGSRRVTPGITGLELGAVGHTNAAITDCNGRLHGRRGLLADNHPDLDICCEDVVPRNRGVSLPGVYPSAPAHGTGASKNVAVTIAGGVTSGGFGGLKSNGWVGGCDSCIDEGMQ